MSNASRGDMEQYMQETFARPGLLPRCGSLHLHRCRTGGNWAHTKPYLPISCSRPFKLCFLPCLALFTNADAPMLLLLPEIIIIIPGGPKTEASAYFCFYLLNNLAKCNNCWHTYWQPERGPKRCSLRPKGPKIEAESRGRDGFLGGGSKPSPSAGVNDFSLF